MSNGIGRRWFLQRGLATVGALTSIIAAALPKKVTANDRLGLGFIGLGGMGQNTLGSFLTYEEVEVRAVCDVYQPHLDKAVDMTGGKAKPYRDFRQLLEQRDIDAVVISTPDHWHALATIRACQAKKHVYVEKPLTHNIVEGRAVVQAARQNGCITQMGIQIHGRENYHRVVDIVRSGILGKIHKVHVWVSKAYMNLGRPADSPPPPGLDWNMWLGPAPQRPFNPNRFLFRWRWFQDYGGGLLADMGCHVFDLVHWAMDVKAPLTVAASGGRLVLDDNTDTPDTLEVIYEYPAFLMTWSHTMASNQGGEKRGLGIFFHGTHGYLVADYDSFELYDEKGKPMPPPEIDNPVPRSPGHHREWLEGIKMGRRCSADVEYGHRLTTVCHIGNIAFLTRRKLRWDDQKERFVNDKEANRKLRRACRSPWKL